MRKVLQLVFCLAPLAGLAGSAEASPLAGNWFGTGSMACSFVGLDIQRPYFFSWVIEELEREGGSTLERYSILGNFSIVNATPIAVTATSTGAGENGETRFELVGRYSGESGEMSCTRGFGRCAVRLSFMTRDIAGMPVRQQLTTLWVRNKKGGYFQSEGKLTYPERNDELVCAFGTGETQDEMFDLGRISKARLKSP